MMLMSFAYLAFSAVLRMLAGSRRGGFAREVELLVLRHEVAVLRSSRPGRRFVPSTARSSQRSPGSFRIRDGTG